MGLKSAADVLFNLSIKAERTSMLLHWPLYWLSRALYAGNNQIGILERKIIDFKRAWRSSGK